MFMEVDLTTYIIDAAKVQDLVMVGIMGFYPSDDMDKMVNICFQRNITELLVKNFHRSTKITPHWINVKTNCMDHQVTLQTTGLHTLVLLESSDIYIRIDTS